MTAGSYGSGPITTVAERKLVAELVSEVVDGRVAVIVHVGDPDTRTTLELARHAERLKVDGVASLTAYYYLHGPEVVSEHFRRLIDGTGLPAFLYNNPKYMNYCVTPGQVAELPGYGLAGIKDSSANIQLFYDIVAAVGRPGFNFLVGSQTILLPALVGGGHGCVLGLSDLFPKLVNGIFEAAEAGRHDEALALQRQANQLRKLTGSGIQVPFYHAALKFRGIDIGFPRAPLLPLPPEEERGVLAAREEYKQFA